ncbi:MAG: M28 family peptidase [Bryobacteraceae bacterium]
MQASAAALVWCLLYGVFAASGQISSQPASSHPAGIAESPYQAADRVSAKSLEAHVYFLASDLLEGRDTPSKGLEMAAEYIAAQFRRAGLQAPVDGSYFQNAAMVLRTPNVAGFELRFHGEGEDVAIKPEYVGGVLPAGLQLATAPVIKVSDAAGLEKLTAEQVRGGIVITDLGTAERRKILGLDPAAILVLDRKSDSPFRRTIRLIDPKEEKKHGPVLLGLRGKDAIAFFERLPEGRTNATAALSIPQQQDEKPVTLRNVIGVLPGSDPELKDTYIILSAHYDHIGLADPAKDDRVFNGANDNASGTASLIEVASALASSNARPKRSIVFLAYFGEEKGLLGSQYYARNPVFPLEKTVAQINLEQLGRTDDSEGPQTSTASLTGFDYSDIGVTLEMAGKRTGVKVYKHETNSDAFFNRSDNLSLAREGIPAHTLSASFEFPDYHGTGDEWDKLDYENLARINRMLVMGLVLLGENPVPPAWNKSNPKTEPYWSQGDI